MKSKNIVLRKYPDAHIEREKKRYNIWAKTGPMEVIIGEGDTAEMAWDDARNWLESLEVNQTIN